MLHSPLLVTPCFCKPVSLLHRKRKTALTHSLVGDENVQLLTEGVDQPSSKRRKQEVEQEEEEGGIGCNHTRGSAFLPVTQSAQMDVATQNSDTLPSVSASHSESSSVMVEDHTELSIHATGLQHTVPSWHKLSTPPVTQWKKLTLPSNLREEERSTETVAVNHGDQGSKSLPSGSLSESKHARKEDGAASIRTNTIRLPEILIDTDSVSSTDEQSSTYTSRASTPTLDSSLQPSPISPNPKQQLLMRLRQRYTSGLSPAPVESWDRVKSRLLNKEVRGCTTHCSIAVVFKCGCTVWQGPQLDPRQLHLSIEPLTTLDSNGPISPWTSPNHWAPKL